MNFTEGWCPGSKAVYFSQNNSYATVPNININNCDFTIAFWRKSTGVDGPIIAIRRNSGKIFYIAMKESIFFLSIFNTQAKVNFNAGDWNHVAITCEQFKIKVFVNGTERVLQERWNKYLFPSSDHGKPSCIIGNKPPFFKTGLTQSFVGSVMDLYVDGRALSVDEIADIFKGNNQLLVIFFETHHKKSLF